MTDFWPTLPTGSALFLFTICLIVGTFVVFMFCLDQFDKPSAGDPENDPWKFVVPRYLAPRRQYLFGFCVYTGALLLIFLLASLIGPQRILQVIQTTGWSSAELDKALESFSTFPVVVAFVIVGLHPSLHLPKSLDFEAVLRKFAHRIAYIPKNIDRIFNHMRFSEFDLAEDKLNEAWAAMELRRLPLDGNDRRLRPLFDRIVLLYVRAATFAGDMTFEGAADMRKNLTLDVFKLYRTEIQNVGVNLQGIHARLSDPGNLTAADRQRGVLAAQRELIRNLEFLYVIFACATTVGGLERIQDRLRALGFTAKIPDDSEVPWNPILKALGAAGLVLGLAFLTSALTFPKPTEGISAIPTDPTQIVRLLLTILLIHCVAIAQAITTRARLISREKYFYDTGTGQPLAYAKIFFRCAIVSFILYLLANLDGVLALVAPASPVPGTLPPAGQILRTYAYNCFVWSSVPACCGVMTAYTIDRRADAPFERLIAGLLQGVLMAAAALLTIVLTDPSAASLGFLVFNFVIYGGLGFILGLVLPAEIRRHWRALEQRLPDKVSVLRTNVLQYFHDIQQFTEWLYARSEPLEGRRPLDVLGEDNGLQRLTTLVAQSRAKVAPAAI
jgi:hypothetical protein